MGVSISPHCSRRLFTQPDWSPEKVYLSFTYFDVINEPTFTGLLNYITLFTQDEVFLKFVLPNTFLYALIVGPGGYVLSFLTEWAYR